MPPRNPINSINPIFSGRAAPRLFGIAIALAVMALDWMTKQTALFYLEDGPVRAIDGLLNWHLAFNRGVSFSLFAGVSYTSLPYILAGFAAFVSIVLVWMMKPENTKLHIFGLGCIVGGALGNAIDRLIYGAVVDFIDVYQGNWHFATFNVADSFINIGVAAIVLEALLSYRRPSNQADNERNGA